MHARERKIATVGDNNGAKNGGSEGYRIHSFLVYEYRCNDDMKSTGTTTAVVLLFNSGGSTRQL